MTFHHDASTHTLSRFSQKPPQQNAVPNLSTYPKRNIWMQFLRASLRNPKWKQSYTVPFIQCVLDPWHLLGLARLNLLLHHHHPLRYCYQLPNMDFNDFICFRKQYRTQLQTVITVTPPPSVTCVVFRRGGLNFTLVIPITKLFSKQPGLQQ